MLLVLAAHPCLAQPMTPAAQAEYVKANYTKYEYRIAMRDGKRLFTSVYVPKDGGQKYPFLITRTPYSCSPYGADRYRPALGPNEMFLISGYIFVCQDVRGRYMSEGVFVEMTPHLAAKQGPQEIDESSDTYDTIEWLVKNVPGNNGRAGLVGISYPGFYAAAGMIGAHPALKAASPQAPLMDLFMGDDAFHNGAFYLAANFGFYAFFGKKKTEPELPDPNARRFSFGTSDGYAFYQELGPLQNADERYFKRESEYWTDLLKHTSYDEFWQARALTPHIRDIQPAVLTVGGWFDAEDLAGPLALDRALEARSRQTQRTLVMGPWVHGGWARGDGASLGAVDFGQKSAPWFREKVEFPFFEHHLKGKEAPKLARAYAFETGTNRWREFAQWPPQGEAKRLYLRAGGKLSFAPPEAGENIFSEYVSDPARPVPFVGHITLGMDREYMVADQRFASARPDVLTFVSDVLDEDFTIGGPVRPQLYLSSSATDSDFVVKLVDVYPDDLPNPEPNPRQFQLGGYQQLVRGEPFRAKFRNSFTKAEALEPGKLFTLDFAMPDVCHTFRRGHHIMVQVQSSWFPLVDRNPQVFGDIPQILEKDWRKATQRLFHDTGRASQVRVTVIRQ
ncbi:MAG: CocE/NonD family hydrolase [Bryobacter sp.]|nr:CocE/NonD family hydrolase [Bryobacter sp.]